MDSLENQSTPVVSVITILKKGDPYTFLPSLEKHGYEKPFEILVVEGGNKSEARNRGITHSKAPLISFIDADCEAPSHWLTSLTASFPDDQMVAGIGGVSKSRDSSPNIEKAIDGVFSTYIGSLNSPSLISVPDRQRYLTLAISSHNCIFRRSALVEVQGFNTRFEMNEDTDICSRLREKGYRLILDRTIFVYHKRRESVKSFAKQFFWYGVGRMRSILTNRRYIDRRIFALFLTALFLPAVAPLWPTSILFALLAYSLLITYSSLMRSRRMHSFNQVPRMFSLFVIEHFSYLLGLIVGIFLGRWKERKTTDPIRIKRYLVNPNNSGTTTLLKTECPT